MRYIPFQVGHIITSKFIDPLPYKVSCMTLYHITARFCDVLSDRTSIRHDWMDLLLFLQKLHFLWHPLVVYYHVCHVTCPVMTFFLAHDSDCHVEFCHNFQDSIHVGICLTHGTALSLSLCVSKGWLGSE